MFARLFGCAVIIAGWLALDVSGASAQQQVADRAEVLFLKNGAVLQGKIAEREDHFVVTIARGEIRVPMADVRYVCGSVDEVYLRERNAIRFGTADQHLQLARWCLKHRLLREAGEQIELARITNPRHDDLTELSRQLRLARLPRPTTASQPLLKKRTSSAELDALVRTMPSGTVESFTKTIQPLLLNGCAAAACHGALAKNGFRLLRSPRGQAPPRRITQRNLHSVMKWLDNEDPASSRLLQVAARPHGNSKSLLDKNGLPYKHLASWLSEVSRGSPNIPPRTVDDSTATLSQAISLHEPTAIAERAPEASGRPQKLQPPEDRAPSGKLSPPGGTAYRPKDPFDPNIFNQRYHPSDR